MARRHWTIMVVPNDEAGMRQYRVSHTFVRTLTTTVVLALAVLGTLSAGFFVKEANRQRAQQLASDNALLVAEVDEIREKFGSLQAQLEDLSQRDEHYRLLARMNPIDEDIRLAGIGGPGTPVLESNRLWQQDPELGELTFATAYDLNALARRARLLQSSWNEATDSIDNRLEYLAASPSIWPTNGYLSSGFSHSRLHPKLNVRRPHEGIDISAPPGTPIVSTAKGRVSFVGNKYGYGLTVEIDHGYGVMTRYAHASRTLVRRGEIVERGDKIAEVGETGIATGPHLHYEVLKDGRPVNPRNHILDWKAILD